MMAFSGWEMPLSYPTGVVAEHLATRRHSGLFEVSHMGRFSVSGPGALAFLRRVLTNDAAALEVGESHYTLLANGIGGAVDDAWLYRFDAREYLLVVNAANREKDWTRLTALANAGSGASGSEGEVVLVDVSAQLAMISLQGPRSAALLTGLLEAGTLPPPRRNLLSLATFAGTEIKLARTGYTGEPVCFEMVAGPAPIRLLWDRLVESGATPCGLGARDTLRLETGLPLYGLEQGIDPEGREIPILSCPVTRFGVDLSPDRSDFVGREALLRQQAAYTAIMAGDYSLLAHLPRLIRTVAVTGRGIARAGSPVKKEGRSVGWVTSGTMVPYWRFESDAPDATPGDDYELRSICLAYLDSRLPVGERVTIDIRGREAEAVLVARHLRSDTPPYARPIVYGG
jgi:aminomethyltransferase